MCSAKAVLNSCGERQLCLYVVLVTLRFSAVSSGLFGYTTRIAWQVAESL